MKYKYYKNYIPLLLLLLSIPLVACSTTAKNWSWDSHDSLQADAPKNIQSLLNELSTKNASDTELDITLPYDGTVFPPEIAAPLISWNDTNETSSGWLIEITFGDGREPVYAYSSEQEYAPDKTIWEIIKANSIDTPATIAIHGFDDASKRTATASSITISTSRDPVDATILYRQVPLPFMVGAENFKKLKWRIGDIASYDEPPVIMENLTTCASCHQVSKDGKHIAMELNYKGDSGAHFVAEANEDMHLGDKDFITWTDFPKPELLPTTRGLFAKLSPSGEYMVSTVNEISYAAVTNDPEFSQLFFPTYGVLGWYSMETKQFNLLPGADDTDYVQTDPSWSWDEQSIAFSRAPTKNEYHEDITRIKTHFEEKNVHELNTEFPIQFDIYTVPFNEGNGGEATPLRGASNNGMSNYFPRYSPNGEWIVFTRSRTGIMLQPDSELFIIPAQGGEARKMRCNRTLFNSWHSFSPNGKWMLFSSKVNSPYTEIYLTHIDENGMDSPPVYLSRFSSDEYAANLPEFVNLKPGAIKRIRVDNHN